VFGADKNAPTDYQGGRTAPAIVQAAMQEVGKLVQSRGGMPGGSGGSGSGGSSNVVELNDASFDAKVLNSKELWVVKFVAPWCGHCKKLEPEYDEAATTLNGEPVKLGSVDATAEKGLGSRFGVEGFPTIKVFAPNSVKDRYENVSFINDRVMMTGFNCVSHWTTHVLYHFIILSLTCVPGTVRTVTQWIIMARVTRTGS